MTMPVMLKTTDVRSRIEPDLKDRASAVLAECGLNLSDAIRLFLRQVVAQQGLPFEVKTPNAMTIAAMREARSLGNAKFGSAQDLFDDLKKAASRKARKSHKKQRQDTTIP
jgi:DNA-damage-inducible protein J